MHQNIKVYAGESYQLMIFLGTQKQLAVEKNTNKNQIMRYSGERYRFANPISEAMQQMEKWTKMVIGRVLSQEHPQDIQKVLKMPLK